MDNRPIGVFDSGIGGLSLVSEIKRQLPQENVIYFADVARQPFGEKTREEVVRISDEIAEFLVRNDAKAILIACSTATAVALQAIREKYAVPVVGIINDRLVNDVCAVTMKRKVGIISTELTAKSGSFKNAINLIDPDIEIIPVPCSKLVNMISDGDIFDHKITAAVKDFISPMINLGADTLVLGCTHFNFISGVIEKYVSGKMAIISPPYSTVGFLREILEEKNLLCDDGNIASYRYVSTGNSGAFSELVQRLWQDKDGVQIEHFEWALSHSS